MTPRLASALACIVLVAVGSIASAQPAREGEIEVVLADGTRERASVAASALHRNETTVDEASCRSCVGRHMSYDISVQLGQGATEHIELYVDYVGSTHESVTLGSGPYPATSWFRVRMRGATSDVDIAGSLSMRSDASGIRFVVHASSPRAPIRSVTLRFPRVP